MGVTRLATLPDWKESPKEKLNAGELVELGTKRGKPSVARFLKRLRQSHVFVGWA